jgi:peptidoglycan/LPS O-acetylase OafA/YrhL
VLPSLTGLRGPAALFVFLFHVRLLWGVPRTGGATPWFLLGPIGVSSFFVLSGFVLTWSHRDGQPSMTFWRNRFARVWPAHAAALVVAVPLAVWTAQDTPWWAFLAQLGLVNPWLPIPRLIGTFNTVCWSLGVEAFFYALFPFVLRALPRRVAALWAVLVVCVALVVGWEIAVPYLVTGRAPLTGVWAVYWFPPVRLPELVAGMALARLVAARAVPGVPLVAAVAAWFGAAWFVRDLPQGLLYGGLTLVPTLAVLAAAARRDVAGRWSLLATRPVVWAGEVSFAFYLVHDLVLVVLRLEVGELVGVEVVPVALFGFAVSVVAAWLLHEVVEVPARRLLRGSRKAPEAASTAL